MVFYEMFWESAVLKERPTLSWNCLSTNGLAGFTEREDNCRCSRCLCCENNFLRFAKVASPFFKLLLSLLFPFLLKGKLGSRFFSPLDILSLYFWNKCRLLSSHPVCTVQLISKSKLAHICYNCIQPVLRFDLTTFYSHPFQRSIHPILIRLI